MPFLTAKQRKGKGGIEEQEKSERERGRERGRRQVLASLGFGLNWKSQEMQLLADLAVSYTNVGGRRGREGGRLKG